MGALRLNHWLLFLNLDLDESILLDIHFQSFIINGH